MQLCAAIQHRGDAFSSRLKEMAQIPDTGAAECDFEEQPFAMFTFFASRAGIRIGHLIAEGQIDSEWVATNKS